MNNHRFLLLPSVRVPDLASHILAQATGRVADDWEARHGDRPVLAYSYVGPAHAGTSYLAAGWEDAGATSGRPPGRRGPGPVRRVWMKSLRAGWREVLREEPDRVAGRMGSLHLGADADWAEREFGRGTHPDGRVRRRIKEMGRCWRIAPGSASGNLSGYCIAGGCVPPAFERKGNCGRHPRGASRDNDGTLPGCGGSADGAGHHHAELRQPSRRDRRAGGSGRRRKGRRGGARACDAGGIAGRAPAWRLCA